MAKMFYSLEETAEKLGVTPSEVRDMVTQGRLQEFRDRDKLMFKVEQVELISGHEESEGSSMIPLADVGGSGIGMAKEDSAAGSASGSAIALEDSPKERSGISIFDADQLEEADPSAVTQVTASQMGEQPLTMESVGSGSGLLDLTREADDTSLGADLLEGVYQGGEDSAPGAETAGTSGLFETTGAASDVSGGVVVPAGLMVAPEAFEPAWSGVSGGIALGIAAVAAVGMTVVVLAMVGANGGDLLQALTNSWPTMWLGASAGAVLVLAIIGWLIGRRG
jgi:hypothetical protein